MNVTVEEEESAKALFLLKEIGHGRGKSALPRACQAMDPKNYLVSVIHRPVSDILANLLSCSREAFGSVRCVHLGRLKSLQIQFYRNFIQMINYKALKTHISY